MDAFDRFAALVGSPSPDGVALDLGWALLGTALDGADPDHQLARLDRIAEAVPIPTSRGVCAHLFTTMGLHGDDETYHHPANSLLDQVLDRGLGLPISLAGVAIEIARRLGVTLLGVGMPGHFLLREADDPDHFVDAFSGGVELDAAACRRVFAQLHGPAVAFDPAYLDPIPTVAVLRRILANLHHAYGRVDDRRHLADVAQLRTCLPGAAATEFQELALRREQLGAFDRAADALDTAAARAPEPEAGHLRSQAQRLRARLN